MAHHRREEGEIPFCCPTKKTHSRGRNRTQGGGRGAPHLQPRAGRFGRFSPHPGPRQRRAKTLLSRHCTNPMRKTAPDAAEPPAHAGTSPTRCGPSSAHESQDLGEREIQLLGWIQRKRKPTGHASEPFRSPAKPVRHRNRRVVAEEPLHHRQSPR